MTFQNTVLVLSGIGVPPYSARGIEQTYEPIDQAADLERTVNGTLINLSDGTFDKLRSTITCDDQQAPALNGVWPGQTVTVDCVADLGYPTASGSPAYTVVPGSSYADGDFTFYRPRITMKVTGFSVKRDEWGAACGWTLELEEV